MIEAFIENVLHFLSSLGYPAVFGVVGIGSLGREIGRPLGARSPTVGKEHS